MSNEHAIEQQGSPTTRSRPSKFTPERLQQIINLVERGKNREEIAEIIGVTTGTLQVTCSRLGISLRRASSNNGKRLMNSDSAHLITKQNSNPEPTEPAQKAGAASFTIRIQYRGEERTTELPLTQDMIGQLAFEAAFRNVSIGEFIGELIVAVVKQDLLQTVLKCKEAENKQL